MTLTNGLLASSRLFAASCLRSVVLLLVVAKQHNMLYNLCMILIPLVYSGSCLKEAGKKSEPAGGGKRSGIFILAAAALWMLLLLYVTLLRK